MSSRLTLLIIWHSRTGASEAMAAQIALAAGDIAVLIHAEDCTATALLDAHGYVFVCAENLGTMSGPMKDMFDRCYYDLVGQIEGRPYATAIAAGSAG